MKLTIDIGNTQIKIGVFNKSQLIDSFCFNSSQNIEQQFESIKKYNFSTSIISSVVPTLTSKYKQKVLKNLKIDSFIITNHNCKINLKVLAPETVGADRICNVAATLKLYNTPAIIVDFGTATTYDVVSKNGDFIGGIIAPGIKTSANNLIQKAALLNTTELIFPKNIIGENTTENIQSGIMYGALDQIEGMVKRIDKETQTNNNIILTGGFSKIIAPQLSIDHILDIDLTLKGMVFINESNY